MLKEWQFNVLFFVGVGGALFLLIGPEVGLDINQSPTAVTGVGAILTYVLTQRKSLTHSSKRKPEPPEEPMDRIYEPVAEEEEWDRRKKGKEER